MVNNLRHSVWMLIICLGLILLGCQQSSIGRFQEVLTTDSRIFQYDPSDIEVWQNEDGDTIYDVWVRYYYREPVGVIAGEDQRWHIDYKNRQYRVSDSYAFDDNEVYHET